ncbi:MAG TPA: LysM domain-containing protein, partial [Opitutaceae bacterium]|nr:LysM domain-containing protein [Opitutaceae bacterium]
MKIHQTIGIVAGVHLLAFLLIFVSPGCSSTSNASAGASAPGNTPVVAAAPTAAPSPVQDAPAPLVAAPSAGPVFYSPTRPNTTAAEALAPAVPPPEVTPAETYTVRSGDSLWLIAHRHHIRVSELAAANNLRSGASLRAGQKLIIPQPGGSAGGAGGSAAKGAMEMSASAG